MIVAEFLQVQFAAVFKINKPMFCGSNNAITSQHECTKKSLQFARTNQEIVVRPTDSIPVVSASERYVDRLVNTSRNIEYHRTDSNSVLVSLIFCALYLEGML